MDEGRRAKLVRRLNQSAVLARREYTRTPSIRGQFAVEFRVHRILLRPELNVILSAAQGEKKEELP